MDSVSQLVAKSFRNRDEIERSTTCGCFHWFKIFDAKEIKLWSDSDDPDDEDPGALRSDDDGIPGATAICPHCEYDSVVGDFQLEEISEDVLRQLHEYWHRSENPPTNG